MPYQPTSEEILSAEYAMEEKQQFMSSRRNYNIKKMEEQAGWAPEGKEEYQEWLEKLQKLLLKEEQEKILEEQKKIEKENIRKRMEEQDNERTKMESRKINKKYENKKRR